LGGYNMEHCCSPDGVTSISVRPYYTMLSRVYLALAMGFLVLYIIVYADQFALHRVTKWNLDIGANTKIKHWWIIPS